MKIIDVNTYFSRWPFRRLPDDTPEKLVKRLREGGVEQAWVSSFDALLHRDVDAVNAHLTMECAKAEKGFLIPWGAVNPRLPDWREDLRRCAEKYKMPGVRLHPNYHGYKLSDAEFVELLDLAAKSNLIVQIAVRMEDPRTQHPLVQVDDVDVTPLVPLLKKRFQEPTQKTPPILLLNALRTLPQSAVDQLTSQGVFLEIAMLEGVEGIARLLRTVPLERVLFGSYAPFFYWSSAALKLQESELAGVQREAICRKNAAAIWKP